MPHLAPLVLAVAPLLPGGGETPAWNARNAEHLLNRAGFGASAREVEQAVALGREALVERLLAVEPFHADPFYARLVSRKYVGDAAERMDEAEVRALKRDMRQADNRQLQDFLGWWFERMVDAKEPLRERMTLFWHGYFTSSQDDVRNSHEMILQNQLLREHALGSFATLLHAIARDPAMLEYLDSASNKKGSPNENFARELLELFTLGEGNYTEEDVREVARAFTGWSDRDGRFRFHRRRHDGRRKTVLGRRGHLDGDDVLDILLEQEACGRHLARRLLAYLEGVEPGEARVERYGRLLREEDYSIEAFLRTLFADPAFYSDDVVGARVASPVDYLVGVARRLGVHPPSGLFVAASSSLGERLLHPPNVAGWEGGDAWITTGGLIARGNFAGLMLGRLRARDILDDEEPADDATMAPAMMEDGAESGDEKSLAELQQLRRLDRARWRPRLMLFARLEARGGGHGDTSVVDELCDELLAVAAGEETRAALVASFTGWREEAGLSAGELAADPMAAEELLRRAAHAILSLPEAQLH